MFVYRLFVKQNFVVLLYVAIICIMGLTYLFICMDVLTDDTAIV